MEICLNYLLQRIRVSFVSVVLSDCCRLLLHVSVIAKVKCLSVTGWQASHSPVYSSSGTVFNPPSLLRSASYLLLNLLFECLDLRVYMYVLIIF